MEPLLDDVRLKALLKEALMEVLEERREDFYELLSEALEDIALSRAIQEGEATPLTEKQEIFDIIAIRP